MSQAIITPDQSEGTASPFLSQVKDADGYRNYSAEVRSCVKELYRLNHTQQTLDLVLARKAQYGRFDRAEMGIWEAMEYLNTLVDDSDPDIDLSQIDHALQTAEAIRQDGHPRWFILTGLIHDLGKVLCLFGEPQWAVVGDTFPVGCAYSDRIVYSEFFRDNPDYHQAAYQTPNGIYEAGCGLDNVHLSWGHDEYLYTVVKNYLPKEGLWMIRYHSCYPVHRESAYAHLMNEQDQEMLKWVRSFNPYDLYSKCDVKPNLAELKPFYEDLIAEYFPSKLKW
ncbi:MAG TPA: inositol oxygenase family protein [Blastocatellia bacterium]|nr:inositol oxygenase family protein [Blastocatellia bacterium]